MVGRERDWASPDGHGTARRRRGAARRPLPELLEELADRVLAKPEVPRHLDDEMRWRARPSRTTPTPRSCRSPSTSTATTRTSPTTSSPSSPRWACFGLSIPEEHGGFAQGESEDDFMSMVVVTEELSRGSLGVAGSLITRPEILSKALVKGGTDEQKERWLPPSPPAS
jgi:(2S)-methylsuccinyl-CoA dehydrogenase